MGMRCRLNYAGVVRCHEYRPKGRSRNQQFSGESGHSFREICIPSFGVGSPARPPESSLTFPVPTHHRASTSNIGRNLSGPTAAAAHAGPLK